MHEFGIQEVSILSAAALLFYALVSHRVSVHELAAQLADGIDRFRGGGPGSPSHPIPGDDSRLLTRKRSRIDSGEAG